MNAHTFTISSNFAPLVAVIDATVGLQETATAACVSELRQKIAIMELDAESFADLLDSVPDYKQFQKDSREYNVERMSEFSKFISGKEQAMHAAALMFTESNDGTAYCDCQAFRLMDESTVDTIRYSARYSGLFNGLWSQFMAYAENSPAEAFEALEDEKAAALIRAWYASHLEEKRETEKAESSENASGSADVETVPEDAPEWLVELFNACESMKRTARAAWVTDDSVAEQIIPPVTAEIQDSVKSVLQRMAEQAESEEKAS